MTEVGAVIGFNHEVIHWHLPPGNSSVCLPDSRTLWEVLWKHRHRLYGFAHSHPGGGVPGPSHTDLTTFAAVEAGLGRRLCHWIITQQHLHLFLWHGPGKLDYDAHTYGETKWTAELRRLSYEHCSCTTIEYEPSCPAHGLLNQEG